MFATALLVCFNFIQFLITRKKKKHHTFEMLISSLLDFKQLFNLRSATLIRAEIVILLGFLTTLVELLCVFFFLLLLIFAFILGRAPVQQKLKLFVWKTCVMGGTQREYFIRARSCF